MIKNIIFDFGGVIYDIDHNLSKQAFEKLGIKNFDQLYGHEIQAHLFEKMERGELKLDEFRAELKKHLPKGVSDDELDDAWCGLLIGFDEKKIDLLEEIGKNYQLFLLSNSNIIHYKRFIKDLNSYRDFRSLFTDVWYSHEKGLRKPEKESYLNLLEKNYIMASETLFVDDLDINIKAAEKLGLKTHHLEEDSILDMFTNGYLNKNY